jgi:hypothetical protein
MECHSEPHALSNWRHGTRTAQSGTDTERGWLKRPWKGFELKPAVREHLGIVSRLSPLLRMLTWLCHSLCRPEKGQTQVIIGRMPGNLKPRIGHAGQCPEGKGGSL